ncbi:unnamed protein product [Orchesella dallaii]|uniref:Uncharacterized protein n=1 Tax=Orchesella dallaii TaxID=48710 RepID=A0ABP1R4H3_9HEXA
MRHKKTAVSTVYRPNRFSGPGNYKSRGKRWKDVVAVARAYEAAEQERERERLEANQTESVSAAETRGLNRLESNDAEGRFVLTQSESVNVTATRTSEPQENVRGDSELCQINIEGSGGGSRSEVQFLGEVKGQAGEDERLNMLDGNRIDNTQRFLDSLSPLPATTPNDFPQENFGEPVAHCSTTFYPLPNLNPTTRISEPQENVRREAESCQINIEGSEGGSRSEVQFLDEVEGQAGEDERLNMLDWNRIDNIQRFLGSLPPPPATTSNDFPQENFGEPVHCSTPLPNLNPTTSTSFVISNDAAPSQVNTVGAGENNNEKSEYDNMQLQNWVSELVSQEVGKLIRELRKQGREVQATLKAGQDEIIGALKQIIERIDALNEVRDQQDTVAQLPQTMLQSGLVDGARMSDRMGESNQHRSNAQRYSSPVMSLQSSQLPKRQGQFKRKASLKKLPRRPTLSAAVLNNETEDAVGRITSTPQPAIQASVIPLPTMNESSYRILRNRRVKTTVYVRRTRIDKQPVQHVMKRVGM